MKSKISETKTGRVRGGNFGRLQSVYWVGCVEQTLGPLCEETKGRFCSGVPSWVVQKIWSLSIWRWVEDGIGVRMEKGSEWRWGEDGDGVRMERGVRMETEWGWRRQSEEGEGVRMEMGWGRIWGQDGDGVRMEMGWRWRWVRMKIRSVCYEL